jgi:hypothetical protein
MTTFEAYASEFEYYPRQGRAFDCLSPLFAGLSKVDFSLRVADQAINQGQMASDFDQALENALIRAGASPLHLPLPPAAPQEFDFAFSHAGGKVAVEIEKVNREKILRDILKCHMYLHAGADLALVVLVKNYCHKLGVWNLFDFGSQRFQECEKYGFGTPDKLSRILLVGFEQFGQVTAAPITAARRHAMRQKAAVGATLKPL